MKSTGITREVDHAGRIVLPMELRRNMGINDGDALEIYVDGRNIVLSPVSARPLLYIELERMSGKPIFCRRGDNQGNWEILGDVCTDGKNAFVVTQDDKYYCFNDCNFYDKEV